MFHKRRSTLGRRHLLAQQQVQNKPAQLESQPQPLGTLGTENSNGRSRAGISSWRGQKSGKKKTPSSFDKSSREFKKCLFTKSPRINYMRTLSVQGHDRSHHFSNENMLNETGISSIASTPSSSSRLMPLTPATAHQRRAEIEMSRYGPLPSGSNLKSETVIWSSKYQKQTSLSCDFDSLKPPASPEPSRLDRLIMEEKLEQPVDPDDLRKMQGLSLEDPNMHLKFSPPLSSTCIGSPDSGKKNSTAIKDVKESVQGSAKKLSTIAEDFNMSVIETLEFEQNEQTISELDETVKECNINSTVKPNSASCLESIYDDHKNKHAEEFEQSWESVMSRLDNMERAARNRAIESANQIKNLKQQIENLTTIEKECHENINNIINMKKTLTSLKNNSVGACPTENKENNVTFLSATCKKKQLNEESKWFNKIKAENPNLLKTPNLNRRINQSSTWTPHSLSKVLHDQIYELYD